jgi:hypothetical protein
VFSASTGAERTFRKRAQGHHSCETDVEAVDGRVPSAGLRQAEEGAEGSPSTWMPPGALWGAFRLPLRLSQLLSTLQSSSLGAVPPPTVRHTALSARRTVPTQIRSVGLRWLGRAGSWLGCGAAWCADAAAGCALGHLWNAEMAWAPCTGAGCVGGFIGCTYGTLWEWQ